MNETLMQIISDATAAVDSSDVGALENTKIRLNHAGISAEEARLLSELFDSVKTAVDELYQGRDEHEDDDSLLTDASDKELLEELSARLEAA